MRLTAIRELTIRQMIRLPALATISVLFASCSMFGEKEEEQPLYYSAKESPALELPEGLDRPVSSTALIIYTPLAPLPQREMKTAPPRISSQSTGEGDGTLIRWSSDGAYLLIGDSEESVYRRLGLVIERSGLAMSEISEQKGYNFNYSHTSSDPDEGFFSKMAFWRDDAPNYSGSYQAVTVADSESTRVLIKNSDGSDADPDAAEHLLTILGERLG
jgi:uncharacterized lipoprotein